MGLTQRRKGAKGEAGFGLVWLVVLLLIAPLCRGETINTTLVPALGWDVKKQGSFPVSLASDAAGNIWVGTEGNGVWRYDVAKKDWTQFTSKDGLGDDCVYALAVDQLGRVWAGHVNHGVSVYNGDKWKNYGLLEGPIGDRVFSIAVSPKDGDVWIATDMGLARYSEKRQDWDYYTRASGLPSDQVQSVTFDNDGNIYAGTQCDGIAISTPGDDYTKWRAVRAGSSLPPAQYGAGGLVSNLVNAVTTVTDSHAQQAVVLTPRGFSSGKYDSTNWLFSRGADWKDYDAHPGDPATDDWLSEDWVTALVQAPGLRPWFGYRKQGINFVGPKGSLSIQANVEKPDSVTVRAILFPAGSQVPLVAAYDARVGGLLTLARTPPGESAAITGTASSSSAQPPPLPAAAPVPVVGDTQILSDPLAKFSQQLVPGEAYYLADDWRTEGDWVGRYGSGYVKLCGMAEGDEDYDLQPGYKVRLQVGPHHEENAAGPVSFHDDEISNDVRSLYDPSIGHRRDAEEDDFSDNEKVYPETYDGPDLWVKVSVPDSVHCLSLYFLNNDAHTVSNAKYRDYDVTIAPDYGDDEKTAAAAPLARTRVTDFWGGVYKQFLVCGPADFVVRIGRNRSFGTRLQAVFLDRVTGDLTDTPGQLPGFNTAPYAPPDEPDDFHPTPLADAAVTLWSKLDDDLGLRGAIPFQMPLRIWCFRAAVAGNAPAAIVERWRWQISIWTADDRKKFDDAMKAAYDEIK